MFDLKEFVRAAISGMIGNEPDYKVREYALGWLDRKVLTEQDLAGLDAAIAAFNLTRVGPEITEPMELYIIPPLIEPEIDPGMMVEPPESSAETTESPETDAL